MYMDRGGTLPILHIIGIIRQVLLSLAGISDSDPEFLSGLAYSHGAGLTGITAELI
jgi:hypothetical protein